jgi:hypothetical protein
MLEFIKRLLNIPAYRPNHTSRDTAAVVLASNQKAPRGLPQRC